MIKPKKTTRKTTRNKRVHPLIMTPSPYFGGKVKMFQHIVKEIPEHTSFVEVFVGGGAVFWGKKPSKIEILNDNNGFVMNFYKVLMTDFRKLNRLVKQTLHSRLLHLKAKLMYQYPFLFTDLEKAWAFWCLCSQSFGGVLNGSWRYEKKNKSATATSVKNKKLRFHDLLVKRLEGVTLECRDAVDIIPRYDNKEAFFYADPPYIGASQGHYAGYNEQNYTDLLEVLSKIEGKFLLSSYPSEILDKFVKKQGWFQREIRQTMSMNGKPKIEVLTANYPLTGDKFVNEVRKVA